MFPSQNAIFALRQSCWRKRPCIAKTQIIDIVHKQWVLLDCTHVQILEALGRKYTNKIHHDYHHRTRQGGSGASLSIQ